MLTGYIHHIAYIILSIVLLYYNDVSIFILYFIAELPTLLFNLGNFNKSYRNDIVFGTSFFLTRLLYFIFLSYLFRHNTRVFSLSLLPLLLHIYWFYNWYKKYGNKKNDNKKND